MMLRPAAVAAAWAGAALGTTRQGVAARHPALLHLRCKNISG